MYIWCLNQVIGTVYNESGINLVCKLADPLSTVVNCTVSTTKTPHTEDTPWITYKEEDGHHWDGFMLFCTSLFECQTAQIHPKGDHLPSNRHATVESMSPMTMTYIQEIS